jgi:hypothetical protein
MMEMWLRYVRANTRKGSVAPVWREVLMREPCVYCGGKPDGLDHIKPESSGGGHGWQNRAPACVGCDQSKGALPLVMFLAWRARARRCAARRIYGTQRQRMDAERTMVRMWARGESKGE